MGSTTWTFGHEYLCLGVSWRTGAPCLDIVDVATVTVGRVRLLHRRIGLRAATAGRFCTGRYGLVDATDTQVVPCPANRPAGAGGQCESCASQDEFRFVHRLHVGGYAPDPLLRYLAQPHWVYLLTFADGSHKIGTAAEGRKRSRIDEQGAVLGSYVARAGDGRAARHVEDAITRSLDVPQSRRRAAKVAALAYPQPRDALLAEHARTVQRVLQLLGPAPTGGVEVVTETWTSPTEMAMFLQPPPGGWLPYPHELISGEHGLYIDACAGPAVLARTDPSADAARYLVDLGSLRGSRIVAGDFASPLSAVQAALF